MPRGWTGPISVEGEQTGDGRVFVVGTMEWPDGAQPLRWDREDDGAHLGAVSVGSIDMLERRTDGRIWGAGTMDDAEGSDGAEYIRLYEAGAVTGGISVDLDDYEVQIIDTTIEESDEGGGGGVLAAAGDPDPGEEGGVLLFEDASDAIIVRFLRSRIRGATLVDTPAFEDCRIVLDGTEATAEEGEPVEEEAAAVAASAAPVRPPAEWFAMPEPQPGMTGMLDVYGMPAEELLVEQRNGGMAVPLVITEDGRVFGHLAQWGQPHRGFPGAEVVAPESTSGYAHFHIGEVVCADGERVATGPLVAGCDHALGYLLASEARDHYAHNGLGWADVRATNGTFGVWVCGVLRPEVTESQLRVLRASALSGDWRRLGGALELVVGLAVNGPGFPIAREAVTASGLEQLPTVEAPRVAVTEDVQVSLVASGVVRRCAECQRRASLVASGGMGEDVFGTLLEAVPDPRIDEVLQRLRVIELRTRHLVPEAAKAAAVRLRLEPPSVNLSQLSSDQLEEAAARIRALLSAQGGIYEVS